MKNFKVFSDSTQLAQAAAQMVIESAACAVAEKGNFHLVLSGGSTPGEVYSLLSQEPYRSSIDWKHVHLWWGDERCVAPEPIYINKKCKCVFQAQHFQNLISSYLVLVRMGIQLHCSQAQRHY